MKAVQDFDNQITPEQKAFVFAKDNDVWTWGRLTSEVNRLARGLIGLGIQRGDRVALHMANLPEFVVAYLACFQVGAVAAPLNIRLKNAELEPFCSDFARLSTSVKRLSITRLLLLTRQFWRLTNVSLSTGQLMIDERNSGLTYWAIMTAHRLGGLPI
jgi:acyl-CoA synthetase (AMP-forming)/AMP-acid ligase II